MGVNEKKYENLILALCKGLGGSVFGKKKLAKLLYFVDFDSFEYKESMKSITGDTYKALPMGPVPDTFMEIIEKLVETGRIKQETKRVADGYRDCEVFTAVSDPDETCFNSDELTILNRVIRKYGGLNGGQLETLSHSEAPWLATEQYKEIFYELAFYRGTDFSDVLAAA